MAEARGGELLDQPDHLRDQVAVVGNGLAAPGAVVEVMVQLYRGLYRVQDYRVTGPALQAKAHQDRDGARGGDCGLLERLEADELGHRGAATEKSTEPVAAALARVKLEVIRLALVLEAPDLAVAAVFHQSPDLREVLEGMFQLLGRHWEKLYAG